MAIETRQQEIDKIWHDHRWLWFLPGVVTGLIIGLPIQLGSSPTGWFLDGIWPETLGILVTVFLIDRLNRQRDAQQRTRDLQERLVREAHSTVNDVAMQAINELRERGWLAGEGGLLKGADLRRANLQGVEFHEANLQRVNFEGANLQGVELRVANLEEAILDRTNLSGAHLWGAKLQGAYLIEVSLYGADLSEANLQGTVLEETKFDKETTLPDRLKWADRTDLFRFTDPMHPDFWRSEHPFSPAYRYKDVDE